MLYSARLVAILDAYLNSRKIDGSYDKLTDLLVCDSIKSTLPEGCLKHILAIESSKAQGWLSVHELSEAVDLYFANRWQNDRPRAGALGLPATTNKTVGAVGSVSRPPVSAPKGLGSSNGNRKTFTDRPTSVYGESVRRCFVCGSKSHMKNECPERDKSATPRPKVNTCQLQNRQEKAGVCTSVVDEKISQSVEVIGPQRTKVQVCAEPHIYDDYHTQLQYVNVKITDHERSNVKTLSGLHDTGAEISVIRTDVLSGFDVPPIGKVKLRGIVGSAVSANLVRLNVALSDSESDNAYITVLCAVCPEANDDLVLTGNVVENLLNRNTQVVGVTTVTQNDDNDDEDQGGGDVNDSCDVNDDELTTGDGCTAVNTDDAIEQQNDANTFVDNVNGAANRSYSQSRADAETLRQEQISDESLRGWWSLAKRDEGGFFVKDNILYHSEKILGQNFSQLCLPKSRRAQVLELGHDIFGGHHGEKRTCERIRLSLTWPTLTSDCKRYCQTCTLCQKRARKTFRDKVPITPIPRAEAPFTHWLSLIHI